MSWDTGGGGDSGWDSGAAGNSFDEPARNEFADGSHDGGAGFGGQGEESGGGRRGGCFNCGEDGHNKSECPQPPKPRPCYNCGQEGHSKIECPNPAVAREFSGNCRLCEQVGHRASDCPSAPPKLCNNCKEEGHSAGDCKSARKIDRSGIADIPAEEAWAELRRASAEGDLDDMKEAVAKYIKATPDITYVELEKAFRSQDIRIYLIALEKELAATFTNMDLQGYLDKKYTVSYRKSPRHARPKEKDSWPQTPEENLERLKDAGEPVDRGIPKCGNCDQLGHIAKSCPEEKIENADRAEVKCFNCDEVGHRVRDCPNPRPDKFACRNCKQSGHSSKECPEPRSAEGVECKKCNEIGHFSRDCPQGGGGGGACHNCGEEGHRSKDCTNEKVIICRNCDEKGHTGRECPKPRDYSRVKCSNCDQMGHTKVRCKEPLKEENIDGSFGGGHAGFGGDSGGGEFGATNDQMGDSAVPAGGEPAWESGGGGGDPW